MDLVSEAFQGVLDPAPGHQGDVPLHRGPTTQDDQARQSVPLPVRTDGRARGAAARGSLRAALQVAAELHALADNLGQELYAAPDPLGLHKREVQPHVVLARPSGVEALTRHVGDVALDGPREDRKSTRLNSSHANISYAVFC